MRRSGGTSGAGKGDGGSASGAGARAATIVEVARAAGVSKATVSNILRGRGGSYADATVVRVRETADRLHYVPNRVARNLLQRRTHLLGVVWTFGTELRQQSYFLDVLSGAIRRAGALGYQVTLLDRESSQPFAELRAHLQSGLLEGIFLVAPRPSDEALDWARASGFPAVVVGEFDPDDDALPAVDVDNEAASFEITRHLTDRGHRAVGFLGGAPDRHTTRARRSGYERALRAAGVEPDPGWARAGGEFSLKAGRAHAPELLRAHPELTALVCATDRLALGALQALREGGLRRVPDDLSLVGFDDMEAASMVAPALTTMRQPLSEIGALAAQLLVERIDGGASEPSPRRLLTAQFIARDSVRDIHDPAP